MYTVIFIFKESKHMTDGHWPLIKPNVLYLQCYDRTINGQICNVNPLDAARERSRTLLAKLVFLRMLTTFLEREY